MEYFFIVPIMAALANISCLIENIHRDHPFHKLMSVFYLAISIQNAATAAMCLATTNENMVAWWIFQAHSFFILPSLLVGMASFSTGRKILNHFTLLVFLAALSVDFFASSLPYVFIGGFKQFTFGMAPLLTLQAGILGAGVQLFAIGICIYFFLKPIQWNVFFEKRLFISVFLLWWIALFTNFFPLYGVDLPPLHPVADSILSVTLAVYLNRYNTGKRGIFQISANLLVSIALGVMIGTLFHSVLKNIPYKEIYVSSISALVASSFLSFLLFHSFKTNDDKSIQDSGLEEYGLSKQEIRICELLEEGHSRDFIQLVLNVSNGTLRNHLMNIYSKILPESKSTSKDQLQRLTIFLAKRKAKIKSSLDNH